MPPQSTWINFEYLLVTVCVDGGKSVTFMYSEEESVCAHVKGSSKIDSLEIEARFFSNINMYMPLTENV